MATRKAEATVARIMACAAEQFLLRSYAEVTMDQIAEAAQVTKGALYHHFAGKEDLYCALLLGDFADKRERFAAAIAAPGTARERLRRLSEAFFSLPREKRRLTRLVRRDINTFSEPTRGDLVRAYQSSLPELVQQVLEEGMEAGDLAPADARLLSWHFVSLVEVVLSPYADAIFADEKAKLDHVLQLFFRGAAACDQGDPT